MNTNLINKTKWFSPNDIDISDPIKIYNLHGMVLPHAGTSYSGKIISHTLRFQPKKKFKNIVIFYLPASKEPDIDKEHEYHEFFVPKKCLELLYPDKKIIGFNMLSKTNPNIQGYNLKNTFFVISADFSHFLDFEEAIEKENCAAKSLMFKNYNIECTKVVDDKRTFKHFFDKFNNLVLDWVGRTRSPGYNGVGYLSFLIRSKINLKRRKPNGFFITAYDSQMRARECLGEISSWNKKIEANKISDVLSKARTTSRLTGGKYLDVPVKYYQITYLFESKSKNFIRGWHSISAEAFFLSDVFLENTFEDGIWIESSKEWNPSNYNFNLDATFKKLHNKKMGLSPADFNNSNVKTEYRLFTSEQNFKTIKKSLSLKKKLRKSKSKLQTKKNNLKF